MGDLRLSVSSGAAGRRGGRAWLDSVTTGIGHGDSGGPAGGCDTPRRPARLSPLRLVASLAAALMVAGLLTGCGGPRDDGAELSSLDAVAAVVAATAEHSLVALGEHHLMQEWHDFMGSLLLHRGFADHVDDIVVEFGNALYQDVADRFILELEQVGLPELSQIWRNTIGGRVLWDAPVYEQFFRNVRKVNEELPRERRIRVLLGDPDVDFSKVHTAADFAELDKGANRDAFYAAVVEREVIARGRRAVLIAGADHLRRGVHANTGRDHPTVATLLTRRHPGELFIFYPLPFGYDQGVEAAVEEALRPWPRPSAAHLTGSWLGAQRVPHRALARGSTFQDQVDAVIWFGPATTLTASRPSPELYRSGDYAAQLRRRSELLSEYFDEPIDYIEEGLRIANAGPRLSGGR